MATATLVVNPDRKSAVFNCEESVIGRLSTELVSAVSDGLVKYCPEEKTSNPNDCILKTGSARGLGEITWELIGFNLGQRLGVQVTLSFA